MIKNKQYLHLPRIDSIGHYQFITFRTKESLDSYLKQLYSSNDVEKIKQYKMDKYLDSSKNGALLYGEVVEKIRYYYLGYDKKVFEIEALSIMPNHIHVLLKQNDNMANVMRVLKGGVGHIVNKTLDRSGAVWSRDYYDKAIRDEKHFWLVYEYIKYNAVKANLNDANERFYGRQESEGSASASISSESDGSASAAVRDCTQGYTLR